jgi:hypothetical protein
MEGYIAHLVLVFMLNIWKLVEGYASAAAPLINPAAQ